MRLARKAIAVVALTFVLGGCAQQVTTTNGSSASVAVHSDLTKARNAVLNFLSATSGTNEKPTAASLKRYGFTISKLGKDFKYFSASGGVRFCVQESTSSGATYKVYILNNSVFSSISRGGCVAGTDY